MINFPDALKTVLENIQVLPVEEKPILESAGQVIAEDIYSDYSLPMTRTGGPDGYAVRSADIAGASREKPVSLRVIDNVRAGQVPKKVVTPGTAIRIMTGSALPNGADCVIKFEDTDEPGNKNGPNPHLPKKVEVYTSLKPWENVRPAGGNITKGSLIMSKGTAIGPAQISVLAGIGKNKIKVFRRPVCSIIATGDELISQRQQLTPGKVFNCNNSAISALVTHYAGIPRVLGIARDRESSLRARINRGLEADVLITTGGVSMGDYDIVRLFMSRNGRLLFAKLHMGPGASFAFGTIFSPARQAQIPFFGLAGPPVGCLNNFELLVRPALMKMMGFTDLEHPAVEAIADDGGINDRPVDFIRWVKLYRSEGTYRVRFNTPERTGMFGNMTTTNAMVIIPEGREIKRGDRITALPLDWCRNYAISNTQ